MTLFTMLASAFKGGGGSRVPLARGFTSPWAFAFERAGTLYRGGWTAPSAPAAPAGGSTVDAEARTAIAELLGALSEAGILPA
jgi:hypothetical protein